MNTRCHSLLRIPMLGFVLLLRTVCFAQATDGAAAPPTQPSAQSPTPDPQSPSGKQNLFGGYTPNLGFKLADTESGDLSVSIYTYARYLNQHPTRNTYTDFFGVTRNVQQRQDFQIQKVQIKFLGWVLSPKLRYFLYAWTSNATMGQPAQVVVAGNLNYSFNKHLTLSTGITSLPGVRSTEGNFPFWVTVDARLIADEFFRPSYTTGVWVKGDIVDRLSYQAMIGNNMSQLGVSASQLDGRPNTVATALVWTPTGSEFGPGFGDFENHTSPATRLGVHFTRSDENKQSQPNTETFDNTQIRLSDGTVVFTPDIFGPGVLVEDVRVRMTSIDAGVKYRGYSLDGEYYFRWLDNFRGIATEGVPPLFDHGFQLQGTAMVVPKLLQLYLGASKISGEHGNPWDARAGVNWFPWKNKVVRWNAEALYLMNSPSGTTSLPYSVGSRGFVFHTTLELAF